MKKLLANFAIVLALYACTENISQVIPQKETTDYSSIKFNDRFDNPLKKGVWDSLFEYHEAVFAPVYLGDVKPEIKLIYKPELTGNRIDAVEEWEAPFEYDTERRMLKYPTDSTLLITVDTSRIIGYPMCLWEYYKTPEHRQGIMSYPVFVENTSDDTLQVGEGDVLPITIEAKRKDGQWHELYSIYIYECGTGLLDIYLAPHQIAVVAMPVCEGTFRTELRLGYCLSRDKRIYSNEFEGFINQ